MLAFRLSGITCFNFNRLTASSLSFLISCGYVPNVMLFTFRWHHKPARTMRSTVKKCLASRVYSRFNKFKTQLRFPYNQINSWAVFCTCRPPLICHWFDLNVRNVNIFWSDQQRSNNSRHVSTNKNALLQWECGCSRQQMSLIQAVVTMS